MVWIRVVEVPEAQGETLTFYQQYLDRLGYVPGIMQASSLNEPVMRAHYDLYRKIMYGPSDLTRVQREMIGLVVSSLNECHY